MALGEVESEVVPSVVIADVFNEVAEEDLVVGQFAAFNITSYKVAENTAEVFMTSEGKEGAGVGEHAHEAG